MRNTPVASLVVTKPLLFAASLVVTNICCFLLIINILVVFVILLVVTKTFGYSYGLVVLRRPPLPTPYVTGTPNTKRLSTTQQAKVLVVWLWLRHGYAIHRLVVFFLRHLPNPTQKGWGVFLRLKQSPKAQVLVVVKTSYRIGLVATKKMPLYTTLSRKNHTESFTSHIEGPWPKYTTKPLTASHILSRDWDTRFCPVTTNTKIGKATKKKVRFFAKIFVTTNLFVHGKNISHD